MIKSVESMAGRLSNFWPWKKGINENAAGAMSTASQEERLNRAISPYESMFIVTAEFRLYSVVCLTMLIVFVYNLWVEEIWPEIRVPPQDPPDSEDWTPIHPSVLSAPEISHHLSEARSYLAAFYDKALTMRQQQPALFCGVSCSSLFLLWLVGRTVPGVWLLYLLLNTILLLPGACIHLLPPNTVKNIAETSKSLVATITAHATGVMTDSQEADLMPEETPETMALLSLSLGAAAGHSMMGEEEDLSSLLPAGDLPPSDDNGDSSTTFNSLTPALGMMPSHEDESLDGLELLASELEPTVPAPQQVPEVEGIRFRSRHFNGNDDSSSDEDGLGRGLSFPDPGAVVEPSGGVSLPAPLAELLSRAALESVASSVAQTLAGAVGLSQPQQHPPPPQQQRQASSDDDFEDDFEIIDQGDLPSIS
ncbi:hypothetical protein B566_EDAN004306 [Ephemera danica]|nr:hypothetical protein B566_EDAN004306 [Ephemera danica]